MPPKFESGRDSAPFALKSRFRLVTCAALVWRDWEISQTTFQQPVLVRIRSAFEAFPVWPEGTAPWQRGDLPLYDCGMNEAINPGPETAQATALPEISVVVPTF